MRRILLIVTGFAAGMLMLWLLLLNVNASLLRLSEEAETAKTISQEATVPCLSFPYEIPGTNLVVERPAAYDGPFLEDGSGREVANVAAIVLRNCGTVGIEEATVVLTQGERELYYDAQTIPPGQKILVLERNENEYIQKIYNSCTGAQTLSEGEWWSKNAPKIDALGMGTLVVTNHTEKTMKNIWLYYKNYLQDPEIYVGGITYKVGIRKLEPGQTLEINPPNYALGYSRIARIIAD